MISRPNVANPLDEYFEIEIYSQLISILIVKKTTQIILLNITPISYLYYLTILKTNSLIICV